ncbi:MAG: ADP-ribosylation factor-like protein [Promethearchaeota archaeon]
MSNINNKDKSEGYNKVVVMGLDNSGKTSIVLSVTGKVNLLNYLSLDPTLGHNIINFNSINSKFNIWDLGGQESFRDEYLDNFAEYITGASKLIFVIDIQDVLRYDLALKYFESTLKRIEEMNLNLDLTLFLHKYDPDLKELRPEITEKMILDLIEELKNVIPNDFYYEIYKTTIYTVFDKILVY